MTPIVYEKLREEGQSSESLLSEHGTEQGRYEHTTRHASRTQLHQILILLLSSCLTLLLGIWIGGTYIVTASSAIRYTSVYSPIVKDVDMSVKLHRFNGSLLKPNAFRGDAGPETDAAWQALGVNYHAVVIPESEAAASGLRADQVKINDKYGGGYPANVEGLHHLHCLNLLRQALYYNYDYYHKQGKGPFVNADHIVKHHVTHCMDVIRQQLMCKTDIGVLGQVWWKPAAPEAFVDFNTQHKCRDFEAIRKWAEVRQMPAKVPDDYLEPPKPGDRIFEEIP